MSDPFTVEHLQAFARLAVWDDGERRDLQDWQLGVAADLFAGFRENWLIVPEGNGKALALDTPIPTPDGWTQMGALEVGDEIFDDLGQPCRVIAATSVLRDRPCFRVVFSDRTSIVADAEHLWRVRDEYRDGRCRSLDVVKTTAEIAERQKTSSGWSRYSAPKAEPLKLPEAMLPVEPYVLGAWLGDGTSSGGSITFGEPFVRDEIASCGYVLGGNVRRDDRVQTRTVLGLKQRLATLGVLGNKHIPPEYLRASCLQRLHLLQGLMDTDGTISTPQGQASLVTISMRLAADVLELVRTIGLKATVRERRAKIDGRDCGPAWVIQFHPYDDTPVFRMPRKFARQRSRPGRRSLSETRRLTNVVPIPSVPVRCIQVDSPSQLFLAGEGMVATHNSSFVSLLALYGAHFSEAPWIPVGAASAKQARIVYDQAAGFVERTPELNPWFKCFGGYKLIRSVRNGGIGIEVFAADVKTGDGVIPYPYALLDELHRQDDLRLYGLWKGKLRKRNAQLLTISTAGEPETPFENARDEIRRKATERQRNGSHLRATGPGLVLNEWMVPSDELCADMAAVKAANPLWSITEETLAQDYASPTMDLGDWRRLKCNRPTRSVQTAITDKEWDDAQTDVEAPRGALLDVGLDWAPKWDTTALVGLWRDGDVRILGPVAVLVPPRDGSQLHPDEVKYALNEIMNGYKLGDVVMDTSHATDIASWIEDELGVTVIDRQQTNKMACEDYQCFMDGLRNGTIKHNGDHDLRSHTLNAIARRLPGGDYRFDRPMASRRAVGQQDRRVIDALTAAAMVVQHSTREQPKRSVYEEMYGTVGG